MKTTQKKQIREYLEKGGKLTQMAALNFWGCFRLASRIHDINEDLHNEWLEKNPFKYRFIINAPKLRQVKTEMVKTESGKYIAEYSLKRVG